MAVTYQTRLCTALHSETATTSTSYVKELIGDMVCSAMWRRSVWCSVTEQLTRIKSRAMHTEPTGPGCQVPEGYAEMLDTLEVTLSAAYSRWRKVVYCHTPTIPGHQGASMSMENYRDPVSCVLALLSFPTEWGLSWESSTLFQFLNRHIRDGTYKERCRLDASTYEPISDLAALDELLQAVRSHRPRCRGVRSPWPEIPTLERGVLGDESRDRGNYHEKQWETLIPLFDNLVRNVWPRNVRAIGAVNEINIIQTKLDTFRHEYSCAYERNLRQRK